MGIYTRIRDHFRNLYSLRKFKKKYKVSTSTKVDKTSQIEFTKYDNPQTTIIITIDSINFSTNCLESIYNNLPRSSFEIILVFNKKTKISECSEIAGIKIINNNLDLIQNINQVIKEAQSEYIYLLSNNSVVHKGFLDELLFVFNNFENVGAVGSMLINTNGRLVEAGSYFLNDAVSYKITNIAIYSPEINYIYQVDYCSTKSLLFKRKNSEKYYNLLDEEFSTSYYQDADFCFRIKNQYNKKIYFTPFSKITSTCESNVKDAIKEKNQDALENRKSLFYKKWNLQLNQIHSKSISYRIQELHKNKTIIFYHYTIPQPDNNSGDLRLTEIIKTFALLGYHCTIIAPSNKIKNIYNEYFQKLGIYTYYDYKLISNYKSFFEKLPKNNNQMWFSTSDIFLKYFDFVRNNFNNSNFIYDMVDIHHLRFQRALEFEPDNKRYQKCYKIYLEYEKECVEKADITISISEVEKTYMTQLTEESKLMIISNIHYLKVKLDSLPKFNERKDLLFIGSSHHPNIDAIKFLIEEILPIVWQKDPEINLNIVGNVNKYFPNIEDQRINFLGYIPDITEQFLKNRIMVAPLRYGAGVKGKIGQAFEYFLPVVTSSIGSEGMYLEHGKNSLLADNAQDFAEQIIKLYHNEKLWIDIQNNLEESLKPFSPENLINKINIIESIKK